jgi:hypothetical protein
MVMFRKVGSEAGYAAKVYGDVGARTSWRSFGEGQRPAWALRPVYEALWSLYGAAVHQLAVTHPVAETLAANYALVLNSAPAPHLCQHNGDLQPVHRFPERHVWYIDQAPKVVRDNLMIYSGRMADPWFRSSRVFGVPVTEFPEWVPNARLGSKVLKTDCTCHPSIIRIGRWGMWTPGVLLHHAFHRTEAALTGVAHAVQ